MIKINKKGQADIIGNFISTIPKPILMIFFIMFLSFIVFLLSPLFNAFGVFCDANGDVVRLEQGSSIFTNFGLISSLPSASEIQGESIEPDRLFGECTVSHNGSNKLLVGAIKCINCDAYSLKYVEDNISNNIYARVCIGDAFINENASSFTKRIICATEPCMIPAGYYYEVDSGNFECVGECSSQTLANLRNNKLSELGAYPLYITDGKNSFDGLFRFGCTNSLRVEPTIKGIAIFRMEYWAIIILISLLLWGISKYKR